MTRRFLTIQVLLVVTVLAAVGVPFAVLYGRHERSAALAAAGRHAAAIAAVIGTTPSPPSASVAALADRYARSIHAEVTVVDRDGHVLTARSKDEPDDPDAREPALLRRARAGQAGTGTLIDDGQRSLGAAEPVTTSEGGAGAVLVSVAAAPVERRIHRLWAAVALLAVGVIALASLVGWQLARWTTGPLARLTTAAVGLGRGSHPQVPLGEGPPEVQQLAAELDDAARRIDALLEAQRQFLDHASHQLRTPLTALRLRIENLDVTDDGSDPEVGAALAEADRLGRLLDGLLMLSRTRGQRQPTVAQDVAAIVDDRAEAWRPLAEEQGATITTEVRGTPPEALLVDGSLEQVLDNLIANALEVTPAGGTLRLGVRVTPTTVDVHVVDEGPGIAPAVRDHVFERFWQGPEGSTGSAGLGLAIVHELVAAARGSVTLHDAPGGGLDVAVHLQPARAEAR